MKSIFAVSSAFTFIFTSLLLVSPVAAQDHSISSVHQTTIHSQLTLASPPSSNASEQPTSKFTLLKGIPGEPLTPSIMETIKGQGGIPMEQISLNYTRIVHDYYSTTPSLNYERIR